MSLVHHLVIAATLFVFGAVFGSFLNVCLYRIPAGLSVFYPPSRCSSCGAGIRFSDNIPVLGWLKLGGRCRDCREAVSIRYPVVEFLCGALPALFYLIGQSRRTVDILEAGLPALFLTMATETVASLMIVAGCFAGYDHLTRRRQHSA